MEITPSMAKNLLETSPGNRRLRGWYVDLLAAAMRRGEWRVTSQGIGIDCNGHLRDAHHRLNACVKSGVSFPSVVVMGMREDANEVIDIGKKRSVSDLLEMDQRIAEVIKLGCIYACGTTSPTIDQMRPFIDAGFGDAVSSLVEFCGTKRKFFSSAPMKLAACVTIMNGGNADFVLGQYRALCTLHFDQMSASAQALVRQISAIKARAIQPREGIARGMSVFDERKANATRVIVSDDSIDAAVATVKSTLHGLIKTAPSADGVKKTGTGSNARCINAPALHDAVENERAREWVVDFLTGLILVHPGLCPHITEALEGILYEDIKGLDILIEVHSLLIKNPTWTVNHILSYFSRKRWHDARNAIARIASMTIFTLPSAVKTEPVHLTYLIECIANNTALQAMRRGPKLI